MGKLKSNEFRQLIIKAISISFSIFFIIILFNTIFFNRTIAINYSIPVMIIGTCLVYLIIFSIYCIYKNKNFKFLEYNPKKVEILCILLIIFIIQYIFATLTYAYNGWDCGGVVSSAFAALQGENFNALYYSQYPNNIGILLLIKYVLVIARLFTDMTVVSSGFFSAIVFNIMMVDIAALFTFLTIKKVLGNKSSYLSLIFIVPLIIFSPYIIIPYTDTITMAFPIILLYLYIIIKELPRKSIRKYLLILLEGLLLAVGVTLKPTVIIISIAIIIIEILNIKIISIKKNILKNFMYLIIILILFITGFSLSYISYSKLKEKNLGSLISQEEYNNNSVSFTHFFMMGMQERKNDTQEEGKNQILYGAYNGTDVANTVAIKGYKEKQEYNLQIIKERLNNFGVLGYIKFLYNKANWILSDGTFFYGQEGTWKIGDYYNQSKIARIAQQFIDANSNIYKNITSNIMQISWILITIGLVFSINKEENKYINIGKLSIIGIVLFILMFEGRSRYLINYIPIFVFIGIYGLRNSLKKLLLTLKHK